MEWFRHWTLGRSSEDCLFTLDFQDGHDKYSWVFVLKSQSVQLSILELTRDFSSMMAVYTQVQSSCSSNVCGKNIPSTIVAYEKVPMDSIVLDLLGSLVNSCHMFHLNYLFRKLFNIFGNKAIKWGFLLAIWVHCNFIFSSLSMEQKKVY